MSTTTHTTRTFNHATIRLLNRLPPYVVTGKWLKHILQAPQDRVNIKRSHTVSPRSLAYEKLVRSEMIKAGWL